MSHIEYLAEAIIADRHRDAAAARQRAAVRAARKPTSRRLRPRRRLRIRIA